MKLFKKLAAGLSALAMAASMTAYAAPALTVNAVDDNNDDWLHAVGSRLYDKDGNEVWLTGANWFGFNCSERCAHYLWSADCDDLLREVSDRGINIIRFPVSTEVLYEWMIGEPKQLTGGGMQAAYNPPKDEDDGNGGIIKAGTYGSINKEFVEADGKTLVDTLTAFDIILGKCKKYGIKAFIDVHSPHADNSGHVYNLWYGKEMSDSDIMVTTDIWIDTLVWMADRYKNDDTLLGFDLENEPHGKGQEGALAAKWDGSTDENNWAYAATRCADAILDKNPNALILIEGVEQSMSGAMAGDYWGMGDRKDNSPYIGAWWGGNFRGAREYPITPEHGTSQIVYSPHDYGPSVYNQTWFDKDFNEDTLLKDYWYDTWAYINAEDIAPMLIGEWGGHMDGAENQKWMVLLRDYMIKHHINHTFWCLNTNSGDTGGLWKSFSYSINDVSDTSNGTTITWEEDKYALFEEALWQTSKTGKYIGLDHQHPLGINGTGLSLTEYYASYDATEGSNLDAGGKTDPVQIETTPVEETTLPPESDAPTDPPSEETTAPTEATTAASEETDVSSETAFDTSGEHPALADAACGDVNQDNAVDIMDVIALNKFLLGSGSLDDQGQKNADVDLNEQLDSTDSLNILKKVVEIIDKLPVV